jgi:tetratricopeptide (TPR) repeat protein
MARIASVLILASLQVSMLYASQEPAIALMARGDYQYQAGEHAAAIISFQQALKSDPELVECHYKLGKIYFGQQAWQFALYHYETLVRQTKTLTYVNLHLDALFELAHTHYKIGESVDPGSDKNPHLVKMQENLRDVIRSFEPGGLVKSLESPYVKINKDYYLARAWYILARIYEDKNRDQEYPQYYQNAIRYLKPLRENQTRAENIVRVAFRESECLYALYRHHRRIKEYSKADVQADKAKAIQKNLLAKAARLEADPATAWNQDITIYKKGSNEIAALFSGKIRIDPLFKFFPTK